MTVLDLVRKLVALPPDMEVVVQRSGQRREMDVLSVIRLDIGCREREKIYEARLLTDWRKPS